MDRAEKNQNTFFKAQKEIKELLTLENLKSCQDNEILYHIEMKELESVIATLRTCKLPKKYHDYKDALREHIKEVLSLEKNDTVFFTDSSVYIKIFATIEMPQEGEKRACGLDPEMLESYKEEYFPQSEYRQIALEFLPFITEDILSFKRINPLQFKKLFIPAFVNMIEIIIIERSDLQDLKIIRGFAYYILRELFDDLMLQVSGDILFNFANQDKKAIEFLSCFSVHEKIDEKGIRYKPNPILDDSNHAWNMTTIRSTMLQHKRAKQAVYDKKNSLISIKEKLQKHKTEQIELSKDEVLKEEELQGVEAKIENVQKTIEKLKESEREEVTYKEKGKEYTYKRRPLLRKMLKKEDDFLTERQNLRYALKNIQTRIENKQKDIDIWEKKYDEGKEVLATIEQRGHPTDGMYDAIKKGLAKAMTKR